MEAQSHSEVDIHVSGATLVLVKYNSFRLYRDIKSEWEMTKRIISWTSKKILGGVGIGPKTQRKGRKLTATNEGDIQVEGLNKEKHKSESEKGIQQC